MTLEHAEQSILSTYRRSHLCALSTFPTRENVKTRGVEDRLRPGSSRRNNLDLSNGRRTHTHTHTRTRARRSGASRRATRCEPDEPRTNGATNQWCDGPSLLSLTQRVYHTETDGRISPPPPPRSLSGEGWATDPPLDPLTLDRPYYARVCENDLAVLACRAVANRKRRRFRGFPR